MTRMGFAALAVCGATVCCAKDEALSSHPKVTTVTASTGTGQVPVGLSCLSKWYGGAPRRVEDGTWMLELSSEVRFAYDDGRVKTDEERLEAPDLEDTLGIYLKGNVPSVPERRSDVGRRRHVELFRATYGRTEEEVRKRLVRVSLAGTNVMVHRKVAPALERVNDRLAAFARDDGIAEYLEALGGGFRWRTIEGTKRLSAHAFGIAIDLNPRRAAYFRWNNDWNGEYSRAIVEAFEAEGFIWGGHWKHFDSMHFEYRPELLEERCGQ